MKENEKCYIYKKYQLIGEKSIMLRDKLCNILNNNIQIDTTCLIVNYIIHNLERIGEISIYDIARECHTSTATISRFCRKIGYPDFIEFRDACQLETDSIAERSFSHPEKHATLKNGIEDLSKDISQLHRQMIRSIKKLSLEKVMQLVGDIRAYKNVFFLGLANSSIMYGHLQYELLNLRKYCHVLTWIPDEGIHVEKENCLAVVFSMHGHFAKYGADLVDWVKENCATSWEISQVTHQSIMQNTLCFGKCEMITADYMAWIYVAEVIIYEYKRLLKKSVTENETKYIP